MLGEDDMALIDVAIPVVLVLAIYAIRYFLQKKPLVYDLYGKKSKKITKHDDEIKCINEYISDAETNDVKEIKVIADADEVNQIINCAKNKDIKIKAIIGPDTGTQLENINLIEVKKLETRPEKHFAIIGPHLLIESPHPAFKKDRSVLCITYPAYKYFNYFSNIFDKNWSNVDNTPPKNTSLNVEAPDEDSTANGYNFSYQV